MFKNLEFELAFGLKIPFHERIRIAKEVGYQGIDLDIVETERMRQNNTSDEIDILLKENDLKLGGWHLPFNIYCDDYFFERQLHKLEIYARNAQKHSCKVAYMWVLPYSNTPYKENLILHKKRLAPIAKCLEKYDCSLAIEFIGTKSVRSEGKYEFIHTIDETLKLINLLGRDNIGLLLDSWHWYTSHGDEKQISDLGRNQILYVQINDAPLGLPAEQQLDRIRCLPGETGVIDLPQFIQALKKIEYNGPITPEPFPLSPLMSVTLSCRFPFASFSIINEKIEQYLKRNFWRHASALNSNLPKVLSPSMRVLKRCRKTPALEAAKLSAEYLDATIRQIEKKDVDWQTLFLTAFSQNILPSNRIQDIPEVVIIGLGIQKDNFKQLLRPLKKRRKIGQFVIGKYNNLPVATICQDMGALATEITLRILARTKAKIVIGIGFVGALQSSIAIGSIILPTLALRGEGTTKYYAADDVEALPNQKVTDKLRKALTTEIPLYSGPVFTTGAIIKEEESMINRLESQGIYGIECETSALFLISQLLRIQSGAVLVVTDNPVVKRLWLDPNSQRAIQKGLYQSVLASLDAAEALTSYSKSNAC